MTRALLLPGLLLIALTGCGGNDGDAANAAAANQANGDANIPPPKTPVLNMSGTVENQAGWIEAQPGLHDPQTAPYGNMLDQPVVNAPSQSD